MSILGSSLSAAQIGLQSLAIKPKRYLQTDDDLPDLTWQINSQITLEEVHSDEMEVTEHPVEQGATIADHAFARPAELVITMAWSNSPSNAGWQSQLLGAASSLSSALGDVIGAALTINGVVNMFSSGASVVVQKYSGILALYNNRRLFDVYTGKRVYKNMIIKSLSTTTDSKTEESLILRMSLKQILIAQTQTVTVPDSSVMANPSQNAAIANMGVKYPLPSPNINLNAVAATNIQIRPSSLFSSS